MGKHLKQNGWFDESGDPEHLIYFEIIVEDGRQVWQSCWHDLRDLAEDPDELEEFRKEVQAACDDLGIEVDLAGKPYSEWKPLVREASKGK